MGHIDEYTRRVYAEILFGFIRSDYQRVAEVHFEAGYVPADRDVDEFARALRAVGEPIFGMDATRISMARLLTYLFEVTERFGMETRTELILLQRTMVVVEGRRALAQPADQHLAGRAARWSRITSRNPSGPVPSCSDLTQDRAWCWPVLVHACRVLSSSALIRQAQETVVPERAVWWGRVICAGAGLVLGVTLMLAVQVIS